MCADQRLAFGITILRLTHRATNRSMTTDATVSEAMRSMTKFLFLEILLTPHRTAVQTHHSGARTRLGCGCVAPELHVDVADDAILE